jgi:hypothetical protein
MSAPDAQLGAEIAETTTQLAELEVLMFENPTRLSDKEKQELRRELDVIKARLRRYMQ